MKPRQDMKFLLDLLPKISTPAANIRNATRRRGLRYLCNLPLGVPRRPSQEARPPPVPPHSSPGLFSFHCACPASTLPARRFFWWKLNRERCANAATTPQPPPPPEDGSRQPPRDLRIPQKLRRSSPPRCFSQKYKGGVAARLLRQAVFDCFLISVRLFVLTFYDCSLQAWH